MHRIYKQFILRHFEKYNKMLFMMGPRQVGKTTLSKHIDCGELYYLNWDLFDDREKFLKGPSEIAKWIGLPALTIKTVVFDEIHKYPRWKTFVKGFFDTYVTEKTKVIVTGSARLDVWRKGGDSLMGRYFKLRVHPLTIGELVDSSERQSEVRVKSKMIDPQLLDHLLKYGGFPEPFEMASPQFYLLWKESRFHQLFREDLRDIARVQEIGQIELLSDLIRLQAGQLTSFASFAKKVGISIDTVKRWMQILKSLYYCFEVRPWTTNISRSLLKEPKIYLWDWSLVSDEGLKLENFVACHLLKAIHFWTDSGFGVYDLYFLRTKEQREVDFLVTKDQKPWFLVEVKKSKEGLSPQLKYFQERTGAKHAFQVVFDKDFIEADCFQFEQPLIVPATTLLSQLV